MVAPALTQSGLVVAGHGRHVLVESGDGQRRICHPRGKKSLAVVGDRVRWLASGDEGTIEAVDERRNLFYRQDEIRSKSFAANLDQILVLLAAEPEFSESQLARALIAAEAQKIPVLIGLNKSDLGQPFERAWARLEPYRRMGYSVLPLALKPRAATTLPQPPAAAIAATDLPSRLTGRTTLVLGPSGAGKSTLINRLVPDALVLTNEISTALNSGKHTTTSTTWYWLDAQRNGALIDSPGFQEFGLQHIDAMHLAGLMPDIRALVQDCKFYNCSHLHEPGCGLLAAMQPGAEPSPISTGRYRIYSELFAELSRSRY